MREKHVSVREFRYDGWVQLLAMDDTRRIGHRHSRALQWGRLGKKVRKMALAA